MFSVPTIYAFILFPIISRLDVSSIFIIFPASFIYITACVISACLVIVFSFSFNIELLATFISPFAITIFFPT